MFKIAQRSFVSQNYQTRISRLFKSNIRSHSNSLTGKITNCINLMTRPWPLEPRQKARCAGVHLQSQHSHIQVGGGDWCAGVNLYSLHCHIQVGGRDRRTSGIYSGQPAVAKHACPFRHIHTYTHESVFKSSTTVVYVKLTFSLIIVSTVGEF